MESSETQIVCFLERPQSLICDPPALPSRRKRREVRLLRKLTCTPVSTKSLSFIQQGTHTKRAGSRPLYGCNAVYLRDNGILMKETLQGDVTLRDGDGGRVCKVVANGLIRSRSFPPPGWKTSQYILQISRICGSPSKDELRRSFSGSAKERQTVRRTSSGLKNGDTLSLQQSMTVKSPSQQHDKAPNGSSQGGESAFSNEHLHSGCLDTSGTQETDKAKNTNLPINVSHPAADAVNNGGVSLAKQSPPREEECSSTRLRQKATIKRRQVRGDPNSPPSGKVLLCGRRREMEDVAVIRPSFAQLAKSNGTTGSQDSCSSNLHFYGVYDGHGGSQASTFCAERLHYALAEEVAACSMAEGEMGVKDWQKAMVSCFAKVDKEVGGVCPYGACDEVDSAAVCCLGTIAPENVGTTAVVAVLSNSQIVVANCGDSRAVLSRGGKAIPLSQDHKPERVDETRRIEAAGGRVIAWKGYRVGAVLALSRAIGDRYLKRYVISEPDVVCLERTEEDECLILASDGLWDVIENDTACNVVRRCLASARSHERRTTQRGEDFASATAAATLVKLAYGKGSQDNITAVVVDLSCR